MRGLAMLAAMAMLLPGACTSETTTGVVLQSGEHAELVVTGSNPWVIIETEGDQPVELRVREEGGAQETSTLQGLVSRRYPGGATFVVTNKGTATARVHVTARGSDGLALSK